MPFRKQSPWGKTKPPQGSVIDWGHPLTQGLVGRWLFNGARAKAVDLTGRNISTGYSGVTLAPGPFNGPAALFDGISGKYRIEVQGLRPVVNAPPFTVVAWVCSTDASLGVTACAIANEADNADFYLLSIVPTTGVFRVINGALGGNSLAASSFSATVNVWYQLVGVWASASDRRVYVNGAVAASNTDLRATNANLIQNTTFGALQRTTTNYGAGKIDNIAIYNRALTSHEILRLYNEPFAGIVAPRRRISGPVAMTSNIKTMDTLARASIKMMHGVAIASVKAWNGIA